MAVSKLFDTAILISFSVLALFRGIAFLLGGLLLAQHFLLPALGFFQTCHETAFLFGLFSILSHGFAYIVFVDHPAAHCISLCDGDE